MVCETPWPPRELPDLDQVIAQLSAAFSIPRTPEALDPDRTPLSCVEPEHFLERLAQEAIYVLEADPGPERREALRGLESALRPKWGSDRQPQIRARLATLNLEQRRAVSALCDRCIDRSSLRQMWRAASEHEGEHWFEHLVAL